LSCCGSKTVLLKLLVDPALVRYHLAEAAIRLSVGQSSESYSCGVISYLAKNG
jgi:hypothetical protein